MDEQQAPQQEQEVPTNEANNEETLTTQEPQEEAEVTAEVAEPSVPEQPEVESEEDEDDSYSPYQVDVPSVNNPIDFNSLPTTEDGTIDADALARAMQQRDQAILSQAANMVQQVEEKRQEERLWQKAFEKNPELKKDKELAQEVQAVRFGLFAQQVESGRSDAKLMTPSQALDRLSKRFSAAKEAGVKQATESVRVQESAYVEPTQNAGKSESSDKQALFSQMRSHNRAEAEGAANKLLKNMLFGE